MIHLNMRTLINFNIPTLAAIFFLLGPSGFCQILSQHRRSVNAQRLYKQYKELLNSENRTSFPEGDIRNLVIDGHDFVHNKDTFPGHSQPEVTTEVVKTHIAATNLATSSRRRRKKIRRKDRKRHKKISKTHNLASPVSLWKKKLFAMRREETEQQLLRTESNELESRLTKIQSKDKNSSLRGSIRKDKNRRKDRRKYRRPPAAKPIKGQQALSLNIARLKQRCKTKPMKQEIKVQGCITKTIMNNMCYGQCNSFYIPEIRGKGNGPPSFTSCGFCRPKTVRPVYVTLQCTSKRGRTRYKRRKVSYVKKCRCMEQNIDIGKL